LLWGDLAKVGIHQDAVMVANAVCCFPHGTPTIEHIRICRVNLWRQIKWCNPKFVLGLGRVANWSLSGDQKTVQEMRGTWYDLTWWLESDIRVFATYHPAAVLRNRALTRRWRDDLQAFAAEAWT
jgi:uracil-DNA glycosylase family 4